ncbi:MAG TPA: iron chelate uptake ABC transporter family permease subunit [Pirellulales bacterium]|nr:iron chelate uptake ABC transporter family permease subunit [Pirellulales bacterium]
MIALSNTLLVMLGTSLLGAVAAIVGSFAVLRRRALVGDLMAHAALPGLCLAFLVLGYRPLAARWFGAEAIAGGWQFTAMLAGAFVTGLAGVACVTLLCRYTRTKEDAAIGIVLSTFFGAGVVLASLIQNLPTASSKAGLQTYIYGQAAGMTREDVRFIAIVAGACLVLVTLLYKEFQVFSFDPGFARAQGWPTLAIDMTMMGTLALVTVVGLPSVGVVLMAAMLIIPGAAARFWTNRLGTMLVIAGLIGAGSGILGTMISAGTIEEVLGFDPLAFGHNTRNLPTGPVIVLCGTFLFFISMLFAPQRGVIARVVRIWSVRRRIERENLLRSLYELAEPQLPERTTVAWQQLVDDRSWTATNVRRLARWAARAGLAEVTPAGARFTAAGLVSAEQLVRTHRLWELYLISGADIAPDHVDRDADSIEHFLTPEIVARLEAQLAAAGQLPPSETVVPHSPHEIPAAADPGAAGREATRG